VDLKKELMGVVRTLNGSGIPYALCGGMAVVLHGYPRLTRDIDLLIQRSDLAGARDALAGIGFTILGGMIPFDMGGPHERKVFRISKVMGMELLTVALLLLPAFLNEVWDSRKTYELEGIPIYVVDRDGLITLKRLAGRPQDLSDIANLEGANDEA
jgi:hypothetical protein